jgi:hypothetical protein
VDLLRTMIIVAASRMGVSVVMLAVAKTVHLFGPLDRNNKAFHAGQKI